MPYALSWAWADGLAPHGRAGIVYVRRFSPDETIALFVEMPALATVTDDFVRRHRSTLGTAGAGHHGPACLRGRRGGPVTTQEMTPEIDARYSDAATEAVPWTTVERLLTDAELYWLATLRPGGSPHVTPVIGLWHEHAAYVCTGAEEQKFHNLAVDPHATLLTGANALHAGTDVVVESQALRIDDEAHLRTLAGGLRAKYGDEWSFGVADGAFTHAHGGRAIVFRLAPEVVYAFGRAPSTHTRYTPSSAE